MQNEKVLILSLLKNGKITSDEAAKIILVLNETSCCEDSDERKYILSMLEDGSIEAEAAMKLIYAVCSDTSNLLFDESFDNDEGEYAEKLKDITSNLKSFANSLSSKVSELYKSAKPKVKSISRIVVSKGADITGNISNSLHNTAKKWNESDEEENQSKIKSISTKVVSKGADIAEEISDNLQNTAEKWKDESEENRNED